MALGAAKYVGLGSLAYGANKFNTQTITTLTKTIVIPSSAGAGLTTGLHFLGKTGSVATVVATAGDIMAHGTCAMASDPALANAALQSIP